MLKDEARDSREDLEDWSNNLPFDSNVTMRAIPLEVCPARGPPLTVSEIVMERTRLGTVPASSTI